MQMAAPGLARPAVGARARCRTVRTGALDGAAERASATGAPRRAQRESMAGDCADAAGVAKAKRAQRGKVRARFSGWSIPDFSPPRHTEIRTGFRVNLFAGPGRPLTQSVPRPPIAQQVITTAVPDTFIPPGQEPDRPKGFWETFFGRDPNKGKVRERQSLSSRRLASAA